MDIKEKIKSLSIETKAKLLRGDGNWKSKEVTEIGLKPVTFSDGPIGVRKEKEGVGYLKESYQAICFPSGASLGQTFNPDLIKDIAVELAKEAKAYDVDVLLGPAINIKRTPLGGRNFEYYSEDPYLTAELAKSYVEGLQSEGVGACIKHFAVNSQESSRMTINSVVDERALHEIYLKAFREVIEESHPYSLMASYNLVNGQHMTENKELLHDYLREGLSYDGLVISDWFAVNDPVASVLNGLDLEMPQAGEVNYQRVYEAMVKDKEVEEASEEAIYHLYLLSQRVKDKTYSELDLKSGHELAKKAALESVVLLKNDKILPLSDLSDVLVVGKFASEPRIQGGGSSHINTFKTTVFTELIPDMTNYVEGYSLDSKKDDEKLKEAVERAKGVKDVILFVGVPEAYETEGADKTTLSLPENQLRLITEISKVNPNIILIIEAGSVMEMPFKDEVKAIFYASLGGEAINEALYELITGKANPCGHIAETFPLKLEDNPSYNYFPGDSYNVFYNESIYVGYRYYQTVKKEVLYPFGYGLSYSEFKILDFKLTDDLKAVIKVKNLSDIEGKALVQVYMSKPNDLIFNPAKELISFKKVKLQPQEEKEITLSINKKDLSYYDISKKKFLPLYGDYYFSVGFNALDEAFKVSYRYEGNNETPYKQDISSYMNGNIETISDEEFSHLFLDAKLPIHKHDGAFDLDLSFIQAKELGSKGAKFFINAINKIKMIRDNKLYYHSVAESPLRVMMYAAPFLAKKNAKMLRNIINDKHYIFNILKFAILMAIHAKEMVG